MKKQGETSLQNSQSFDSSQLLQIAIQNGVDADSLSKLVDLNQRMMAMRAKQDFYLALQEFQDRCPPIPKNKKVDYTTKAGGRVNYSYATLDHISETIRPLLTELGLSYTFECGSDAKSMKVACIVHHVAGHSETSEFPVDIDRSSKMSSMQQSASAMTYCRRYALCNALGITTADTDDDAYSVGESQRRERSGEPGQEQFDNIKRYWFELLNPDGGKSERARRFEKWVVETTSMKPAFANDWKKWLSQHFEQCNDALDEMRRVEIEYMEPVE